MPGAVHPEVAVQGEAALEAGEEVLAAGGDVEGDAAGEVGGGEAGDAQVAAGECAACEGGVEPGRHAPDAVAFGHGFIVPPLSAGAGAGPGAGRTRRRWPAVALAGAACGVSPAAGSGGGAVGRLVVRRTGDPFPAVRRRAPHVPGARRPVPGARRPVAAG